MIEALFVILNSAKVCILGQEQYGSTTLEKSHRKEASSMFLTCYVSQSITRIIESFMLEKPLKIIESNH